jgi:hypothetical protein
MSQPSSTLSNFLAVFAGVLTVASVLLVAQSLADGLLGPLLVRLV